MTDERIGRMPAAERREQLLQAASEVFGERGYIGATTDQIARAAGVSQPYVVRTFGSKEQLFVEVIGRSLEAMLGAFRAALTGPDGRPRAADELPTALGEAYVDLVRSRGLHLSLMQAFVQGHDAVVGAAARRGFLRIWRFLIDDAGFTPADAREFLAAGMLINTLLGIQLPAAADDPDAAALLEETFGPQLTAVLEATEGASAADTRRR